MPDLRFLTFQDRQALAADAERRARAGEAPSDIRKALGLTKGTYTIWAKQGGFRQMDLRGSELAPREIPGRGAARSAPEAAAQVLVAVRAAIAAGDRAGADKLVAAWSAKRRRDKALATLEAEVAQAAADRADAAELTDAALVAEVAALIGRAVTLKP